MDIEEMERITRDQLREIQEEHNRRIAPLIKILSEIRIMRPITITLPEEKCEGTFGTSVFDNAEYQRAQDEVNRTSREMMDKIPMSNTRY